LAYTDFVQRKCAYCGKLIPQKPLTVKIKDKTLMFCDGKCLQRYKEYSKVE
jgi:ribosomal protein L24E